MTLTVFKAIYKLHCIPVSSILICNTIVYLKYIYICGQENLFVLFVPISISVDMFDIVTIYDFQQSDI